MNTLLLKGKPVSDELCIEVQSRVNKLALDRIIPKLAVILIGDDPASEVYVRNKGRAFEKLNCRSHTYNLSADTNEIAILNLINKLNHDIDVHGILIQLPLPKNINSEKILHSVSPKKDVDGFHPYNLGSLLEGNPKFIPCTPSGILQILKYYQIPVAGRHAVIVGRSNIVGKPLFALLTQKFEMGNATVTICHTGTRDIIKHTRQADILIAAAGCPEMINGEMVSEGVDIVDVGINRLNDNSEKGFRLVGDVCTESIMGIANSVTPVPGGVGPMTITMLLYNTVIAAEKFQMLKVAV